MANPLSKMPNVSIPRTRFKMPFNHATSIYHGDFVPIDCMEIIPGDEMSLKLSDLIRMSNPIVPIFGNIKMKIAAFFVPWRLIWKDTEKFYGDPSNHNTVQSITPVNPTSVRFPYYAAPAYSLMGTSGFADKYARSVTNYMGKPIIRQDSFITAGTVGQDGVKAGALPEIGCLKEAAYYCVWNEYIRPSGLIEPCILNIQSGGNASLGNDYNNVSLLYGSEVLKVTKDPDYFTACTLAPQFGDSMTLPLGSFENADLAVNFVRGGTGSFILPNNAVASSGLYNVSGSSLNLAPGDRAPINNMEYNGTNYVGKYVVSTAGLQLGTINELRYAIQVQKYLERSNYGSRYFEILNAHYGVTSPDGRLQRPDYLGKASFYINVNQVLSTAGAAADASSKLGQPGAVSVTGHSDHLFTAAFTEPGYLLICAWTRFDRSYMSGILREDLKKYRFDFYSPEFANLGDQAVKELELRTYDGYNPNSDEYRFVDGDKVFGYQEHWAEYRYRKDRISGILNSDIAQHGGSVLDMWTLGENFNNYGSDGAGNPLTDFLAQGVDFLMEDRQALARALVTGDNGPDYLCDFYFEYIVTRELPLVTIPGLMDHFGVL